jgi:hypothetical protein
VISSKAAREAVSVMGIESLNSAAAAAGFAMVSDEGVDETIDVYEAGAPEIEERPGLAPGQNFLPAIIENSGRGLSAGTASLGARVTGLIGSWRSKG